MDIFYKLVLRQNIHQKEEEEANIEGINDPEYLLIFESNYQNIRNIILILVCSFFSLKCSFLLLFLLYGFDGHIVDGSAEEGGLVK